MKKFRNWLLVIFIIFTIGCSTRNHKPVVEEREKGRDIPALLWEVKSDTATIYLVGTIHTGRSDMYPLPQALLDAFYDSDIIGFESISAFDLSDPSERVLLDYLRENQQYRDGTTIKEHISEETYKMLEEYLKIGELRRDWPYYKPIFLIDDMYPSDNIVDMELILEVAKLDSELGIESYFTPLAEKNKKPIFEIEGKKMQIDKDLNYSPALQEFLLWEQLHLVLYGTEDEVAASMRTNIVLVDLWAAGNADGIREYYIEEKNEFQKKMGEFFEEYNNAMMVERDKYMTEQVIELLRENQNVFFAVGVAHMVGENGIIDQLEAMGYVVTRVQ